MENQQPKITVVTPPDYHIDSGAFRIITAGYAEFCDKIQDAIYKFWPNENVTIYRMNLFGNVTWNAYQAAICDIMFFDVKETMGADHWALTSSFKGQIYYIATPEEKTNPNFETRESTFIRTLKLTAHRQVYNNELAAVMSAATSRT